MARIAGIDLPREKRIEIGLTYIYGIGRTSAKKILEMAQINPDIRVKDLTEDQEPRPTPVHARARRRPLRIRRSKEGYVNG